jgi:hypothetical protein
MAGNKYLYNNAGTLTEKHATQTSAGVGDANEIGALDATGHFDVSLMPVGLAPPTAQIVASELLAAGALVNVWNNAGTANVRNADASAAGKEAHGFVLSGYAALATATVYFPGDEDTQLAGMTPGLQFLSDVTPGGVLAAAPTASGHVVQRVGVAVSATELIFSPLEPIVLA